jgi:hypothetical protein
LLLGVVVMVCSCQICDFVGFVVTWQLTDFARVSQSVFCQGRQLAKSADELTNAPISSLNWLIALIKSSFQSMPKPKVG